MNLIQKTISGAIATFEGMITIIKHAFRKPITLEYPEVKDKFNSRLRGRVALRTKDDGSHFCIGCKSCINACPCGDLIQIKTSKDEGKKLTIEAFTIDIGRCIACGNCTEVCPTRAIVMCDEYELADFSKEALVLDIEKLKLSAEKSKTLLKQLEEDS